MLLEQGINEWRDLIHDEIDDGQMGNDGTDVTEANTGLGGAIAGTVETLVKTKFNKGIKLSYTTDSGDGSGSTAREWVANNSTNAALRVAFPEEELGATTVIEIDSQIIFIQDI